MEIEIWTGAAVAAGLLALALMALLSALESALLNSRRARLMSIAPPSREDAIVGLLDSPQEFQTSAHLSKSLCESVLYACAALLGMEVSLSLGGGLPQSLGEIVGQSWPGILGGAVVAYLLVTLFGEALPKVYVLKSPEKMLVQQQGFIRIFTLVTGPLRAVTGRLARGLAFGADPELTQRAAHSEEEIKLLLKGSAEEGMLEDDEQEMIHSIFAFTDTMARQVMIPRTDITGVPVECTIEDVVRLSDESGHSRLPVYTDTLDNIEGIIHVKQLLPYLVEGRGTRPIRDLLREPYYVPESKKIDELLQEFRRQKTQMAIVVDDFGGTSGLVTVEDVLEEIVGEIQDEYDEEEDDTPMVDEVDGGVLVDARLAIDEMEEALGFSPPEGDYETFGGYVFTLFGRSPSEGEQVEANGRIFVVEELDGLRLRKVRMVTVESPEPAEPEEEESEERVARSE